MNFYAAIKEYETADINSKLEGSTKHDFIKIVLEELYKNYCEDRYRPSPLLRKMVNEQKTFY